LAIFIFELSDIISHLFLENIWWFSWSFYHQLADGEVSYGKSFSIILQWKLVL